MYFKVSLSVEQCYKVLPLISIMILISEPPSEILSRFLGGRKAEPKYKGSGVVERWKRLWRPFYRDFLQNNPPVSRKIITSV